MPDSRSAFATTLRAWRAFLRLSQQAAADLTGVARSQWADYENATSPTLATAGRIAEGFHVTLPELLTGPPGGHTTAQPPPVPRAVAGLVAVPLWDTLPGPAGYVPPLPPETFPVLADLVTREGMVVQEIVDDACSPLLIPGDVVLVDPSRKDPRSVELVVVDYDGVRMIRRWRVFDRQPHLVPDNPMWPMLDVDPARLTVLGVVTDLIRRSLDLGRKTPLKIPRRGPR